ncbi:MAG TPA: efflux transporter outer membrane subunit [Rhizomicrobium sp.]|jgi:multidrug efflux system outer membrane protein|nr:efflux transporter outer membrane subunit [Rhizomicrobium sp.]
MTKFLSSASAMTIALVLAGCATPVPQVLTPTDTPQGFAAPKAKDASIWPAAGWWTGFGSPEMTDFIASAQKDNLSIAQAYAAVLQARAEQGIARSALLPTITGDASAQQSGSRQSVIVPGTTTGTGTTTTTTTGTPAKHFITVGELGLSLDATYQLDLFGKNQDTYRAASEALRSSRYAQEVVALTVTAQVAETYFEVLALRERVKIAQDNIDAANRILTIVKAKVQNGVSSNLDLAQQQAQLAGQEALVPALKEQEREAINSLAVLLGRAPEGFDVKAQDMSIVSLPIVQPGLPSELLRRRPDVAEAEAALAAAHGNVDAARAAFFPSIGLSAQGGVQSSALGSLFSGGLFYALAAQAIQTIFDGGLLSSESDEAKAVQQEDIANYRSTVINAFADTERALGQVSSLAEQERLLTDEVSNAAEAFRISELQYREGVADLLTVLQAQQTLFTAEDTLAQTKLARRQALVGLYQALGGGWSADDTKQTTVPPSILPATSPVPEGPSYPDLLAPAAPANAPPAPTPAKKH